MHVINSYSFSLQIDIHDVYNYTSRYTLMTTTNQIEIIIVRIERKHSYRKIHRKDDQSDQ